MTTSPIRASILSVSGLTKHFRVRGGTVKAVDDVAFDLAPGEVLGVVGESGCGKSTTARLIMGLIPRDHGRIALDGEEGVDPGRLRRQVQMVFQDSYSSLNPRMSVLDSVAFAPWMHGMPRREALARARGLLEEVGLAPDQFAGRYPHELSGGQRQRVAIARALASSPRIVLLDEAVSALDKSVEAQILNLLSRLKRDRDLTYVFISHDLNVIEYISDRVVVMYLGRVVEQGPVADIYERPRHPYTQALLASKLSADPRRRLQRAPIAGDPPNPINPPSGCRFRTRCPHAEEVCASKVPSLGSGVACLMWEPGSGHGKAPA
jgi:peptide/nickel transport system ATP-binding protein